MQPRKKRKILPSLIITEINWATPQVKRNIPSDSKPTKEEEKNQQPLELLEIFNIKLI